MLAVSLNGEHDYPLMYKVVSVHIKAATDFGSITTKCILKDFKNPGVQLRIRHATLQESLQDRPGKDVGRIIAELGLQQHLVLHFYGANPSY
jgi:hypothetical protein